MLFATKVYHTSYRDVPHVVEVPSLVEPITVPVVLVQVYPEVRGCAEQAALFAGCAKDRNENIIKTRVHRAALQKFLFSIRRFIGGFLIFQRITEGAK